MKVATTREEAISLGLKTFLSSKPCRNGSVAERYASSRQCLCHPCRNQKNEYKKRYYQKNREALLESFKEYREKNVEKVKAYDRMRYRRDRAAKLEYQKNYYNDNRDAVAEYKRRYQKENGIELALKSRARYFANHEAAKATRRRYYENNLEAVRQRSKEWALANPGRVKEAKHRRRAALTDRLPLWYGEFDEFIISEAADLARQRAELTGFEWHVDHVYPLLGKKVSGLHCGLNIQVIPAYLNLYKKNRMIMTRPLEWISYLDKVKPADRG